MRSDGLRPTVQQGFIHCVLRLVWLTVVVTFSASCEQAVSLPQSGTPGEEVIRRLGRPNWVQTEPKHFVEDAVRTLDGCTTEHAKNAVSVWFYVKEFYKAVVIAMDDAERVVCAGHGGVTFTKASRSSGG
jgi:hypothetical protein